MSRASTLSQRNLTLTEELEKLEQSITLTLQEIDHNFSRAHRIVTSSILPVVEQYAEHSKNVWEGSKFWKQFFEASANVSLSGYEEVPEEDETVTVTEDVTSEATPSSSYQSPPQEHDLSTPGTARRHDDYAEGASPSPFSPGGSTPKARKTQKAPASIAKFSSPYEDLRRKVVPKDEEEDTPSSTMPSTPRGQTMSEAILDSSPFQAASVPHPSRSTRPNTAKDVLLHRILDKNYKLQATPILPIRLQPPHTQTRTPMTGRRTNAARQPIHNDDLDSSPLMEAPKLHTELFGSPARQRTPGVSVLTPAKNKTPRPAGTQPGTASAAAGIWDSDSDDDAFPEGMSPPKTMQFHIPQSKLLKTPAREASKKIVEDLLLTAGGNITEELDDDSPSVVKRGGLLEEDTF